jgi:beta-lactamase superfamily II metal-dependent hydrolase
MWTIPGSGATPEGFEVDFLPVGDGQKSGDAIAIRFCADSTPRVVVIDAGYQPVGEQLVEHIRRYYDTNRVDLAVSTHGDGDHLNGLRVVVEEMDVGELMMHRPWRHGLTMGDLLAARRVSASMRARVQASMTAACDLEALARRRGIPITEPFTGLDRFNGRLHIAGPSPEYYESLLADFRCQLTASLPYGLATKAAGQLQRLVSETPSHETLTDDGTTSAENNSSAIVQLSLAQRRLLFTADAGIDALTGAAKYLDDSGLADLPLDFIQVPHHGSDHNVGPTILNQLLGPPAPGMPKTVTAFISAAADDPDHPSRKVINAFSRRRCNVYTTEGQTICHHHGAPTRPGWIPLHPLPFYPTVED